MGNNHAKDDNTFDIQKLNSINNSVIRCFQYFLKPHKTQCLIAVFLFAFASVEKVVFSYFMEVIIDNLHTYNVVDDKMILYRNVLQIVLHTSLFLFMCAVVYYVRGLLISYIFPRYQASVRVHILKYIYLYKRQVLGDRTVGLIFDKICNIAESGINIMSIFCYNFIPATISSIIVTIMLFNVDRKIGFFFLILFIVHNILAFYFANRTQKYSSRRAQAENKLFSVMIDSMHNVDNVHLFSARDQEVKYALQSILHEKEMNKELKLYIEKFKFFLALITIVEYFFIAFLTLRGWYYTSISIGEVVFVFTMTASILEMYWDLAFESSEFFEELGNYKQALDLFGEDYIEKDGHSTFDSYHGDIVFQNVTFGYKAGDPKLKNISVNIKKQSKVGLVGFAGSGKSTFIKLIMRQCRPQEGHIFIHGHDMNDITEESLYRDVTIVPQDVLLFNRTIEENILYANPGINYATMVDKAKLSGSHNFIKHLKNQYQTMVDHGGKNFSGGQKQLIGITRAILKSDAKIIIFDEATSALDAITERNLFNNLLDIFREKTVIMIAHQLSNMVDVDRILVFKDGQIIEDGSHEELLKDSNSYYSLLWNSNK